MGKIYEQIINRFDGGMTSNKRSADLSKFVITKHFDLLNYPYKLVPHFQSEAVGNANDMAIVKFLYALYDNTTDYRLWGYGKSAAGETKPRMFANSDPTGAGSFTGVGSEQGTGSNRKLEVFFYYKYGLYGWANGLLWKSDTQLSDAFTNSVNAGLTYTTSVAQPVHHPADDIAYFFRDNIVSSLNVASWTLVALTLPAQFTIKSACAYGNYLAIGCSEQIDGIYKTVVFLWDRDSSLTTLTERIDFGEGNLIHLANLNNKLTVVMSLNIDSSLSLLRPKLVIKQPSGNFAVIVNEILGDAIGLAADAPATRFITENVLYFPLKFQLDGDTRMGIWAVDSNGKVWLDFVEAEATSYEGIYRLGNMWWIAHSNDGSINRTDNGSGYSSSNASVYESLIFNGGSTAKTKKLISVGVMTEPLPAGASVVLKYHIDSNLKTAIWTTVFTNAVDNNSYHEAINIESDGSNLPTFKEIQFRVESLGGAVITGLKFKWEEINDNLSD